MSDAVNYSISMKTQGPWLVGYNLRLNLIFTYYIDSDEILWAFSTLGCNAAPLECIDQEQFIFLGEL